MLTRDNYIALLEKRAMDESSVPNSDSAETTVSEYDQNRADQSKILHDLFTHAGAVQSDMSATSKRVFAGAEGTKISGHPLLKMASRNAFKAAVESRSMLKNASAVQLEVVYNAFKDELEKIAAKRK